jgi:cytochrome c biogenesis protein CcmG/thiol:disulfide interchange protein DsbE
VTVRRAGRLLLAVGGGRLLTLLPYGFTPDPTAFSSPFVVRRAPDFSLTLLGGGSLDLVTLRGKVVVVNFWASWCHPACWKEAARLEAAWRRYRDRGVVLVGIAYRDSEAAAREFIARYGKTYPNGIDPGSTIASDYGVDGVPETFFIDRAGQIHWKHAGEIDEETLRVKIESLLGEATRPETRSPSTVRLEGRGSFRDQLAAAGVSRGTP